MSFQIFICFQIFKKTWVFKYSNIQIFNAMDVLVSIYVEFPERLLRCLFVDGRSFRFVHSVPIAGYVQNSLTILRAHEHILPMRCKRKKPGGEVQHTNKSQGLHNFIFLTTTGMNYVNGTCSESKKGSMFYQLSGNILCNNAVEQKLTCSDSPCLFWVRIQGRLEWNHRAGIIL